MHMYIFMYAHIHICTFDKSVSAYIYIHTYHVRRMHTYLYKTNVFNISYTIHIHDMCMHIHICINMFI